MLNKDAAEAVVAEVERQTTEAQSANFDLDAAVEEDDLELPRAPSSPVTMDDLEQLLSRPELMPPGAELRWLRRREHGLRLAGMENAVRVTTDAAYFEQHAESVELFSPGSPVFKGPECLGESEPKTGSLRDLLLRRRVK